mmetsp:Transcript_26839/g.75909  ORF Transcript_26839/g.75909 Transcript_26839/m.75909 type:complete len:240 (-) Transcript_26839:17-736(-)
MIALTWSASFESRWTKPTSLNITALVYMRYTSMGSLTAVPTGNRVCTRWSIATYSSECCSLAGLYSTTWCRNSLVSGRANSVRLKASPWRHPYSWSRTGSGITPSMTKIRRSPMVVTLTILASGPKTSLTMLAILSKLSSCSSSRRLASCTHCSKASPPAAQYMAHWPGPWPDPGPSAGRSRRSPAAFVGLLPPVSPPPSAAAASAHRPAEWVPSLGAKFGGVARREQRAPIFVAPESQ